MKVSSYLPHILYFNVITFLVELHIGDPFPWEGYTIFFIDFKWYKYFLAHFMKVKRAVQHSFDNYRIKFSVIIYMVVHKCISQTVWTVPEIDMFYVIFIQVDTFSMVSDPSIHTSDFIAEWLHIFQACFTNVIRRHHDTKTQRIHVGNILIHNTQFKHC